MGKILCVSTDDGAVYDPNHLDNPDNPEFFWKIEVNDVITLIPEQITAGYGSIVEILIQTGQARKVLGS